MYSQLRMDYPAEIQEAVDALAPFVRDTVLHKKMNPYYAAVKLLERIFPRRNNEYIHITCCNYFRLRSS